MLIQHSGISRPGSSRVALTLAIVVLAGVGAPLPAIAQDQRVTMRSAYPAQLDVGFRELYELRFDAARADFSAFEAANPGDPVGKSAQAASYLYEEFYRKGVFTSAYFLDDRKFLGGIPDAPDKPLCAKFLQLDAQAKAGAQQILKSSPTDAKGLLALTLADGMMADYNEVIAKKQFASLRSMRQAQADAARLLAVDPGAADADVAIGAANYVLGSLPAYKRVFLWFGGIRGDKAQGMNELRRAAARGHYLKPLAEVLLALASLREHQPAEARNLFLQLSRDFPQNPVFSSELVTAEKMAAGN